ncbi:tetratricopeptide (TPR) repeat protein [Methanohalophilus levihalophilus]|uniref:tetratricopeptide repeat protein n=1 Tax=Methanohalophilus levihalophilus TaxID=1431282 RepID=UPI001AEA6E15|nr:tetratricopeptide repeat protein [Methanohalophilus levihalophilus]MBP2029763.1 tetratricopeptide (TPR) repeat protein [Methanohalophilus levihalophilus]
MSEYESAIECFEKALALDSTNPFVWYNKGVACSNLYDLECALSCFDEVLKIDPSYDNAWINKGLMLCMLGKHQDAIKCYENISFEGHSISDEKKAFVWNNKGIAHSNLEEYDDAINCFAHVLHIDPDYHDAKLNMQKVIRKLSENDNKV